MFFNKKKISTILQQHGFKEKEQPDGTTDLNPYVYQAVAAVIDTVKYQPWVLMTPEQQYLNALAATYYNSTRLLNERTQKYCYVRQHVSMSFECRDDSVPLLTTRELNIRPIIAELLGYFKGFTSAEQFRQLGTRTWDANANKTSAWLANPNRKGVDDLGQIYGAVAHNWPKYDGTTIDLFNKVYCNLKAGIDDRGEIITFWNPGLFELGCLRPCMFQHQFILMDQELHLESYSRSGDAPLGVPANMVQAWLLLKIMAHLTGKQPGTVRMTWANFHIYEDQMDSASRHLTRIPSDAPTLTWPTANVKGVDLDTFINTITVEDFELNNYKPQGKIYYPFSE